jgi:hypothetical protein
VDIASSASSRALRTCASPWVAVSAGTGKGQPTSPATATDRFEPTLPVSPYGAAETYGLSKTAKLGAGILTLAAMASPSGVFAATTQVVTSSIDSISKPITLTPPSYAALSSTKHAADGAPSTDLQHESLTVSDESLSHSAPEAQSLQEGQAPAVTASSSTQGTPPATASKGSPAAAGSTDDVPWYEPANSRAREISDSLVGFKDGVTGYGTRISNKLNDNPVSQYHPQGELGDFHYNVEAMRFKIDPYVTLQANKAGFGSRDELALVRGSVVEKGTTAQGYEYTQGFRGELDLRRDAGVGTQLTVHGFEHNDLNGRFFGTRIEGFEQVRLKQEHGWNTTLDSSVGETTSFLDGSTSVYARALGRADNKDLGEKWLRPGATIRAEAELGAQHNFADGSNNPYYRIYGGAAYPVHFELKGKTHGLELETGLTLQGDRNTAVQLRPEVRARLSW